MNPTPIKLFLIILFAGVTLGLAGCAAPTSTQPRPPLPSPPPKIGTQSQPPSPTAPPEAQKSILPEKRTETEERPGTRAAAALQMTEQGRKLLEQKKVDDAIKVLERAVNLNRANGRNYYYLAEAWLAKKKTSARQMNLTIWPGSTCRITPPGCLRWRSRKKE